MASADEVLSIVTAVLYFLVMGQFSVRFALARWWIYFFLALFCAIRVVAYVLHAFVVSDALEYGSDKWVSLYITELSLLSVGAAFILLVLARLYQSVLPKLREQNNHSRGKFETTLVNHTRLFLLPIIALIVASAVMAASPDASASQLNTALVLRKVAVLGLLAIGLMFLYAAWNYRNRYPDNQKPFHLAFFVTVLFVVSLVYKLVSTFSTSVQSAIWASYVFSPLLELAALCALSGNIQATFLGRKEDKVLNVEESELSKLEEN